MDDYAKNSSHHDSPKDRGHQSDGIIPCKNRLSRDFNIIREIRYQKLIQVCHVCTYKNGVNGPYYMTKNLPVDSFKRNYLYFKITEFPLTRLW